VRSYYVSEQWLFARLPPRPKAGWDFPMVAQHWLSSERGQLIWQELQTPASGPITFDPLPTGYKRQWLIDYRVFLGGQGNGRAELRWPGIEYYSFSPSELAHPSLVPLTGYRVFPGVRAIVLSWWLVAGISALAPLLWIYRAAIWRRRVSKDGATGNVPCAACGYDIRASLQRCPECGYSNASGAAGPASPGAEAIETSAQHPK